METKILAATFEWWKLESWGQPPNDGNMLKGGFKSWIKYILTMLLGQLDRYIKFTSFYICIYEFIKMSKCTQKDNQFTREYIAKFISQCVDGNANSFLKLQIV